MKKYLSVIPLVLLMCLVVGCQDKAAIAELDEFKAQAVLEEANKVLYERAEEAFINGDVETIKEIFSPDYVAHPAGAPDVPLEQTIEEVKRNMIMFSNMAIRRTDLIAKGDKVVVMATVRATHTGDVEGFPATGNEFEMKMMMILRIENGKIVESWPLNDNLSFYQQLGFELMPIEEEK